jgi:hypothetical protein
MRQINTILEKKSYTKDQFIFAFFIPFCIMKDRSAQYRRYSTKNGTGRICLKYSIQYRSEQGLTEQGFAFQVL